MAGCTCGTWSAKNLVQQVCPLESDGCLRQYIGRTKGGLNSKLLAVCDGHGRTVIMLLSEGQMSDFKGARLIVDALPPARHLLAERNPLRQVRPYLFLSNMHRSSSYLLPQSMSPEPNFSVVQS
jgi:hypothetical protein